MQRFNLLTILWPSRPSGKALIAAGLASLCLIGAVCGFPGDDGQRAEPPPTETPLPAPVPPDAPAMVEAQVINVVDGDTIDVLIDGREYRVRYILVDTPETVHPSKPVEPFGPEASAANKDLVDGKMVRLEKDVSDTDTFGRLLRYVYVGDIMVNEELLRRGLATVATFPPDVKYVDRFLAVQQEAQAQGVGLWAAAQPEPSHGVIISAIFYDGLVAIVESDEYAEITNNGSTPVELAGWRLNAGSPGQDFLFPTFTLQPGQVCRVYTNQVHPESCGFSFGSDQPLWANKGGCGYLYDAGGAEVAQRCY